MVRAYNYQKKRNSRFKSRARVQRRSGSSMTRKPRARRRTNGRVPRNLNPFPNTKLVRHKYVDTLTLSAGGAAGLPTGYSMRANSMWDPDFSGVGHQPLFRDEMAAQYNSYTVLSSSIRISIAPSNSQELNFLLWCDDDTSSPTDANTTQEQHWTRLERMSTRVSTLHLRSSYDAAKWLKCTRAAVLADDDQKIAAGSNPSASVAKYFNFYIAPLLNTVVVQAIGVRCEMVFYTMWREPKDHFGS